MDLFEIILISLLGVYVLSSLYFSISGRILTKHVGDVATENHNLTMNLKEYQVAYAQVKTENEELKKKLEEPKKITRKKKETEE